VGYDGPATPASPSTRKESALLVGSMIRASTSWRNTSSPPAAVSKPTTSKAWLSASHRCAAREEVIGNGTEPGWAAIPRSSSAWPAANRSAAAAFNAANSASSRADPRCSIERDPRRDDHTICTAIAPELVFTVRTYATAAPYGPAPSAQIRTNRPTNPQATALRHQPTRHSDKSQVERLVRRLRVRLADVLIDLEHRGLRATRWYSRRVFARSDVQ